MSTLRATYGRLRQTPGVTLVELMVTVAILSIGVLAGVASFRYISTSIQTSKAHTLSNNLAQEQIEKLKNLSYYTLLVTTSDYVDTRFNPNLYYDIGNYTPQSVIEGGIPFVRATRVDFAYQNGTAITTAPWTTNDTGLKLITVYNIWQDGSGLHYNEMHNLMANPAANPLNASFTGTVKDTLNNNIAGAIVQVVDNPNWFGITNSVGFYQFNVSQGSYTLSCSSQGYFSASTKGYQSITSGQSQSIPFTLSKMSSGTINGYAYLDNHLVVSQVVTTTGTSSDLEYIELYNPTTSSVLIGTNANYSNPNIVPVAWDASNNPAPHRLFYVNFTIPANGYYLITNTGDGASCTAAALTINGTTISPDACWRFVTYPSHALTQADAGGVSIGNSNTVFAGWSGFNSGAWSTSIIDSVAWSKNASAHSAPASAVEGTGIPNSGGLQPNEQLVRMSAPGSLSSSVGRAYDSNKNSTDFFDFTPIIYLPYHSTTIQAPITGTPATGAYITFNDPLSNTAICSDTLISATYRTCSFTTSVATGTWTMAISSGTYYLEVTSVTSVATTVTNVPNAFTTPTWPSAGTYNSLLNDTTGYAFVSGVVTDANNVPIPNIAVYGGGLPNYTSSSGRYFLTVPAGDVQVSANYNDQNRAYTSQSSVLTSLSPGILYDNPSGSNATWFTLSLGGILRGYFQTGSNTPLPGRVAVALAGGNQVGQAVSGSDGYFYIQNMTTGTYTVQPSLDSAEAATPSSLSVTLSSTGTATVVSTFTVTNGLSQITGQAIIASSSQTISTGVLVLASTNTLTGGSSTPPPTISGGTSVLCNPCYYAASSDSTSNFTLNVRSSTSTYKLYGWYTTFTGTTPSTTRKGPYSVNVSSAGQILSQNITW